MAERSGKGASDKATEPLTRRADHTTEITAHDAYPTVDGVTEPFDFSEADGFPPGFVTSPESEAEFDSFEEVDAVARTLRRAAIPYGVTFVCVLVTIPILSRFAEWWFARPVWGGLTLNFLAAAVLLHPILLAIALTYTRFAEHVEDEMLGRRDAESHEADEHDDDRLAQ